MAFKNVRKYDRAASAEAQQRQLDELDEQQSNGPSKPRVKLTMGRNVLLVVPSINSERCEAWADVLVHYNPFHMCNRKAPVLKPDGKTYVEDKKFSNCARCQGAWDVYKEVKDQYEDGKCSTEVFEDAKSLFKKNMPSHQFLMQVLNLTPFFKPRGRKGVEPDAAVFKKWWSTFVDIVTCTMKGDEVEVPEDMPEEMSNAAQAAIDLLLLGKTAGVGATEAFLDLVDSNPDVDPFSEPESYLLVIEKEPDSKEFKNAQGNTVKASKYSALIQEFPKGWGCTPELMDLLEWCIEHEAIPDIHDLDSRPCHEVNDKAGLMIHFTNDELLDYLKESKHSFTGEEKASAQEVDDIPDFKPPSNPMVVDNMSLSDPDYVEDSVLNADQTAKVSGLRARLQSKRS